MRLLLALLATGLLAGCTATEAPAPEVEPASALAPEPEPIVALEPGVPYEFRTLVGDTGFEHARLDAATQATIKWANVGTQTHSVVSDDGTFPGSGPIAPGSEFAYTFLVPGDFAYYCRYHPEMTGIVVVR